MHIKCLEIAHLETNEILLMNSRIEQTFIVACTDYLWSAFVYINKIICILLDFIDAN